MQIVINGKYSFTVYGTYIKIFIKKGKCRLRSRAAGAEIANYGLSSTGSGSATLPRSI